MDPHRRIYSGTGSYGMSNHRMQNKGRFSPSPMSSPQCNYPYALMLPQQQQKFNSVTTPSSTTFGYSQTPWAPSRARQGSSQITGTTTGNGGPDVRFVQLDWKDLLGANQNSIGTSGTSQFVLGDNQNGDYSKRNSNAGQPSQGQQFNLPPANYSSQQAYNYGGNGNQRCQNPNCQDCGQSQNESPIKFQVSVGNHGDSLGAPTYTYTFPQQSQQSTEHCSSGDASQAPTCPADSDPKTCPANNNTEVPSTAAAMKATEDIQETPTVVQAVVVPQSDQNLSDPCGSCSACKFKSTIKPTRRTSVGIPTKNKTAPGPTPKASTEKIQPPVISPSRVASTIRKNSAPSVRVGTTKASANNVTKKIGK